MEVKKLADYFINVSAILAGIVGGYLYYLHDIGEISKRQFLFNLSALFSTLLFINLLLSSITGMIAAKGIIVEKLRHPLLYRFLIIFYLLLLIGGIIGMVHWSKY